MLNPKMVIKTDEWRLERLLKRVYPDN